MSMQNPGQGQTYPPAPAPAKKNFFARHKVLTILGGIVLLVVIISVASNAGGNTDQADNGSSTSSSDSKAPEEGKTEEKPKDDAPGLNTPVEKGKFEFTVVAVENLGTEIGTAPLTTKAQGQFVKLDIKVNNISKSAETFLVNYIKLEDAEGRTFDADGSASIYLGADASTWISQINPGNTLEGPVVFDIPADAVPTKLIVNDSAFGEGKTINLQ